MTGTKKVTRTVTEYKTLNSTYQVDESAKEWRRTSGANPALRSQGEDGEWKPLDSVIHQGGCLYVYHPGGVFRTSLVRSTEVVPLTDAPA
jgi:hypothetical protein